MKPNGVKVGGGVQENDENIISTIRSMYWVLYINYYGCIMMNAFLKEIRERVNKYVEKYI